MVERLEIPPAFWADVEECWQREPRTWQKPFGTPFAREEDVFRALLELTGRLDIGNVRLHPRIFLDGRTAGFHLDRHAARPSDGSLVGFQQRLAAGPGGDRLGLMLTDCQVFDEVLWRHSLAFLRGLYGTVGMPAGGAASEIFLGNYRRSFLGLHKDSQETFTFVVQGTKRFLVWPYEVFADQEGVFEGAEAGEHQIEGLDYEPWREQAIVLEGGPGDVLFWPASYWHVAESEGGFTTTVTLGLFPNACRAPGSPLRIAEDALVRITKEGFSSKDPPQPFPLRQGVDQVGALDTLQARLARHLEEPALQAAIREDSLRWLSAHGFHRVPDQGEFPELRSDDRLEVDPANPVIWADVQEEGFCCAINGISLTALPKFLPMLEHMNGGGVFRVDDLVERFAGRDGLEADEIREALEHLGAARAFTVRR